jgi:hypothetical protein
MSPTTDARKWRAQTENEGRPARCRCLRPPRRSLTRERRRRDRHQGWSSGTRGDQGSRGHAHNLLRSVTKADRSRYQRCHIPLPFTKRVRDPPMRGNKPSVGVDVRTPAYHASRFANRGGGVTRRGAMAVRLTICWRRGGPPVPWRARSARSSEETMLCSPLTRLRPARTGPSAEHFPRGIRRRTAPRRSAFPRCLKRSEQLAGLRGALRH